MYGKLNAFKICIKSLKWIKKRERRAWSFCPLHFSMGFSATSWNSKHYYLPVFHILFTLFKLYNSYYLSWAFIPPHDDFNNAHLNVHKSFTLKGSLYSLCVLLTPNKVIRNENWLVLNPTYCRKHRLFKLQRISSKWNKREPVSTLRRCWYVAIFKRKDLPNKMILFNKTNERIYK